MNNKIFKLELNVIDNKISIIKFGNENYISLTDLARYKDKTRTDYIIQNWMRISYTIQYLGIWEYLYNPNFKPIEFDGFKKEAGTNSFVLTPRKWIDKTNAIGIISKSGRYNSGTFAHPDIAFEFASWLSPEFKLYLIKEFERLKKEEANQNNTEWDVRRILAKTNYKIHTDAVKEMLILPKLTKKQINSTYSSEADILNVALFGMTAKEWKKKNSNLNGNIRDYANIDQLIVLSNIESINSVMIRENISQIIRLQKLNEYAIIQLKSLYNNLNIIKLEELNNADSLKK